MEEIEHRTYFDGRVKSLTLVVDGKMVRSVGIVLPGRWFKANETEVVQAGGEVKLLAEARATYLCLYG